MRAIPASLCAILTGQAGVATRHQAEDCGITPQQLKTWLLLGRCRAVRGARAVYLFECGRSPMTHLQRIWAALLAIGGEVAASHDTAVWLEHQTRQPPWLVAHSAREVRPALAGVYAAVQSRRTSPEQLRSALDGRPRHRHRAALEAVLHDARAGAMSGLERRHLHVMRSHGLPPGRRQRKLSGPTGSRWVDVIVDDELTEPLVTELDGRRGHEEQDGVWRDMDRDNLDEEQGRGHLRYGAAQLFDDGCRVAAQTSRSLVRRGWSGRLQSCGRGCRAVPPP